ncbi:MAG: FHA domain-containing protein [Pseudomonadota bacterium]
MKTDQNRELRNSERDHGPQGTHVFSRGEVDKLIEEVHSEEDNVQGAHLTGVSEGVRDQVFSLKSGRVVLGRAQGCDIVISDASVSSEHARLSREDGGWRVANLLSTNGTFINNNKISNGTLEDGDRLRLGRVEFVMHDPVSQRAGGGGSSVMKWLPWVGAAVVVAVILWVALG